MSTLPAPSFPWLLWLSMWSVGCACWALGGAFLTAVYAVRGQTGWSTAWAVLTLAFVTLSVLFFREAWKLRQADKPAQEQGDGWMERGEEGGF